MLRGLQNPAEFFSHIPDLKRKIDEKDIKKLSPIQRKISDPPLWLKEGTFYLRDTAGRNMIIDYNEKKLIPVSPWTAEILEKLLSFEKINEEELKNLKPISNFLTEEFKPDNFLRKKVKELDEKYFKRFEIDEELYSFALEILSYRKIFSNMFGQAPATPATNVLRAKILREHLDEGNIIFIGDGDFLSPLINTQGYSCEVIDIDNYINNLLLFINKKFNLKTVVYEHDLRKPFKLTKNYEAFITDPEYTLESALVFISRGLNLVKNNGLGFISWLGGGIQRNLNTLLNYLKIERLKIIKEINKYIEPIPGFYTGILKTTKEIKLQLTKWKSNLTIIQKIGKCEECIRENEEFTGILNI